MTKLPMEERIRYKKRMVVMKYIRDIKDSEYMKNWWDVALKYTIVKYLSSNRTTELYPRDVLHWFSENDCLRFLRFTRAQAHEQRYKRRSSGQEILTRVKAVVAIVAILSTVASAAVIHGLAPKKRQRIHEPRRLDWDEHRVDLARRGIFRRMYRMDEPTFNKLAELLRPILTRNDYYAKKRTRDGAIPVKIRLAVALRMFAGGSYVDIAVLFGISKESVFSIMWQVVDAINNTSEVGAFHFPQTVAECTQQAERWKGKSSGGAFTGVVAAVDGLFVKTLSPPARHTPNQLHYYSGSKCGYGMNIQATCDSNYRFCSMSCIAPGATNDWVAWNRSALSDAVGRLPPDFYVLGDAAYPLSEHLLTPYPGKDLPRNKDSFNFHLSQLRVKIEQSFGIFVGQWGSLWKPLRVAFHGRGDLITALAHLHNFLRDEKVLPIKPSEEDEESGKGRPDLSADNTLPGGFRTAPTTTPTRSGDVRTRMALTIALDSKRQYRPEHNLRRNQALSA